MQNQPLPPTIKRFHFPNGATHCDQSECGISIYRGVIVQWDEDHDTRVLDVLDQMPARVLEQLLVVQEHEGSISFVWRDFIPPGYRERNHKGEWNSIEPGDGDCWTVHESTTLPTEYGWRMNPPEEE